MKRGPLSNEQKAYIQKNYKKKTLDFFIKKFNKSEAVISKYIEELNTPIITEVEEQSASPIATPVDKLNLFARKKSHGVVIMTESASSAGESPNTSRSGGIRGMKNCIHIIRKDLE